MDIHHTISIIQDYLVKTFDEIDTWFDKAPSLRSYKPANRGWSIDQILEHIGLTNHFLLILIDKGTRKALENATKMDLKEALHSYQFQIEKLNEVGMHKSFQWMRPEHMEPTGAKTLEEMRLQLKEQVARCKDNLIKLGNGEGVLYKTTMTVNNLGKINVYEYIYFLAQHGHRHVMQMEGVEKEFLMLGTK